MAIMIRVSISLVLFVAFDLGVSFVRLAFVSTRLRSLMR